MPDEINVGDRVVCIANNGYCTLELGKEYTVIGTLGTSDIIVDDGIGVSWMRGRFKKITQKRKGLAPGLTLVNLRGRKGVAPELNV